MKIQRPSAAALLFCLIGWFWATVSNAETNPNPPAQKTEVILLGTGTPYPDPNAAGPATAIVLGKRVFLFDAGVV